jgi:hypothetical protein
MSNRLIGNLFKVQKFKRFKVTGSRPVIPSACEGSKKTFSRWSK